MTQIGIRDGLFADGSRRDWDNAGPRPVAWTAWYPAVAGTGEPVSRLGQVFEPGPVLRDADLVPGNALPVILLSHGTGGSPQSLAWLARAMAASGQVVIAAHHHGNTASQAYRPEGFLCWWERATDLSNLLTHLAAEGPLARRLDLSRVSAIGFSLGCYAVLALAGARGSMARYADWAAAAGVPAQGPREMPDAARHIPDLLDRSRAFQQSWARQDADFSDRRVRAIVGIAPPPPVRAFAPQSLSAITVPTLLISGGADEEAPADIGADWLMAQNPRFALIDIGPSVSHYTFLDRPAHGVPEGLDGLFVDAAGVDREAVHRQTVERVLATLAQAGCVQAVTAAQNLHFPP